MDGRSITMEEFRQQYDDNISENLVSSMKALKVLLQRLNSPEFSDWREEFMEEFQDEMKKDLEGDEEKAQVFLGVMETLTRIYEDDEKLEWIERKKVELEEFLTVIEDLNELLPEDY